MPQAEYVPLSTRDDDDNDAAHFEPQHRRRRAGFRLGSARARTAIGLVGLVLAFASLVGLGWTHYGGSSSALHDVVNDMDQGGGGSSGDADPDPEPTHPDDDLGEIGDNPYFQKGDTWQHNLEVIKRLERCEELGFLVDTHDPSAPRRGVAQEAEAAMEGCGWNETTVVILASYWLADAVGGTDNTGETVYAQSTISTLQANGYAVLYSSLGWLNHDMRRTTEYYQRWHKNVRLVLADPEQVDVCFDKDQADGQKCLKTEDNLDGIPAWKLLAWWYWDDPGTPLGPGFTLSPANTNANHFLSFSIEPSCKRLPYVTHAERKKPDQAYVLAKQVHYLGPQASEKYGRFTWTLDAFTSIKAELNVSFAGGFVNDEKETLKAVLDAGIINYGPLNKVQFYTQLAESFVLVGVGQPRISPSPWDALCQGVPFINPILSWDENDPTDRKAWRLQQWHMVNLDPPYVYSVRADDLVGLHNAVGNALTHPIDSYIPDNMKFDWVTNRMAEVVEGDWRGKGEEVLEQWKEEGKALFVM